MFFAAESVLGAGEFLLERHLHAGGGLRARFPQGDGLASALAAEHRLVPENEGQGRKREHQRLHAQSAAVTRRLWGCGGGGGGEIG